MRQHIRLREVPRVPTKALQLNPRTQGRYTPCHPPGSKTVRSPPAPSAPRVRAPTEQHQLRMLIRRSLCREDLRPRLLHIVQHKANQLRVPIRRLAPAPFTAPAPAPALGPYPPPRWSACRVCCCGALDPPLRYDPIKFRPVTRLITSSTMNPMMPIPPPPAPKIESTPATRVPRDDPPHHCSSTRRPIHRRNLLIGGVNAAPLSGRSIPRPPRRTDPNPETCHLDRRK